MERVPNQHNHFTDKDLIDYAVEAAHHEDRTLDDAAARVIASQWHGGQRSELYSFVSTGAITRELAEEIGHQERLLREGDPRRHQLKLLSEYILSRESHEPIEGWAQLWITPPDQSGWSEKEYDHCPACDAHVSEPHSEECPLNPDGWEGE